VFWPRIYRANPGIGDNPQQLKVGSELVIPPAPDLEAIRKAAEEHARERAKEGDPAAPAPEEKKYTVREGDTLSSIAKQHYGHGSGYFSRHIGDNEANKTAIGNELKVGTVLMIPPPPAGAGPMVTQPVG